MIKMLGNFVIRCLHLEKYIKRSERTKRWVEHLYPRENKEVIFWDIWKERIGIMVLTLVGMIMLMLLTFTRGGNELLKEGKYLLRGQENTTLLVSMTKDGTSIHDKLKISIPERNLSESEMKQLDKLVEKKIPTEIRGKNEAFPLVSRSLVFCKSLTECPVELTYSFDEKYITGEGKLCYLKIPAEGIKTIIIITAEYKNWKKEYLYELELLPKALSQQELWHQILRKEIMKQIKMQNTEEVIGLPTEVDGMKVQYEEERNNNYFVLGMILILPVILIFLWEEQAKKKEKQRDLQLMEDYPPIVNRIMLLLGAGLTLRGVFARLSDEYEQKNQERRYAYEELCITCYDMRNGVYEGQAIEQFGIRCQLLPYLRFTNMITQNLKKGTSDLLQILEEEAINAYEQQKETVRKKGEEAGTKLLFPMMVMLIIVMGIIMIPALMTM